MAKYQCVFDREPPIEVKGKIKKLFLRNFDHNFSQSLSMQNDLVYHDVKVCLKSTQIIG